jgi:outer membrane lipoprotein carrier protein
VGRLVAALVLLGALPLLGAAGARAGGAAAGGGADGTCASAVAAKVQSHYDAVKDLEAHFDQVTHSIAFAGSSAGEERSSGEVIFAKPGRMRWSYEKPEKSLVVSDGDTLWLYDPSAHQVQVMPVGKGFLSGAAIEFLLGEGRIEKSFEVKAQGCGSDEVELLLQPRKDATYEHLELDVDPTTGAIRESVVVDLFGNRTEVRFSDVHENRGVAASVFHFEPPAGTQVLELKSG